MVKKTDYTDKPKVDTEAFNNLATQARIAGIRLINSKFSVTPEAFDGYDDSWKLKQDQELLDWDCDGGARLLRGTFEFGASSFKSRRKLISLTGRYLCTYRLSSECDADAGRLFLERVGRFAAYPYFRTLLATLTQQSGLMLPPLPVISDGPRWVSAPSEGKPVVKPSKKPKN